MPTTFTGNTKVRVVNYVGIRKGHMKIRGATLAWIVCTSLGTAQTLNCNLQDY